VIVHVPTIVVDVAIADMQACPQLEVIGFFCMDKKYRVGWQLAENIHPNPNEASEIDARWIAQKVLNEQLTPVAMMHSHPSGIAVPSDHPGGDYDMFPSMYVDVAFIWVQDYPGVLTQYTATKELHHIPKQEVFINVNA
jgi:hypothetical protein